MTYEVNLDLGVLGVFAAELGPIGSQTHEELISDVSDGDVAYLYIEIKEGVTWDVREFVGDLGWEDLSEQIRDIINAQREQDEFERVTLSRMEGDELC